MNASGPEIEPLHVEVIGTGPTVVFSHGVGATLEVWRDFVPVLSSQYRVVLWDQPGHGGSASVEAEAYGPALAYSSLARAIGNANNVVLVGHSLGGYLSARYAIEFPDRVRALVLLATGPGFRSPESMAAWNDDIERNAVAKNRPETKVGLHADSFVIDHLGEISGPSLVLVGSDDKAFLGATDYIEKKVAGIERHTIAGAGHNMPTTHGGQLAEIIREFLSRRLANN